MVMAFAVLAWRYGSAWMLLLMLCSFVFIAPIACIGTYAISAQLERGLQVSLSRTLRACLKRYIGNELVFALVLIVIFLVWARASSMVSIFIPSNSEHTLADMSQYLFILAVIGLIFSSLIFAASVFSLPMMMHRDVDAITAVVTSINAVLRNKLVMVIWGLLIALGLLIGILTLGIGLIVFLPTVGHAVWHGYLETIDADRFPRHTLGITASARPNVADNNLK
jgi:uncharacterized membrane protein